MGILNVLLHGSFAFFRNEDDGSIQALIPRVDDHVVRAGNWLAETQLAPGKYTLRGVDDGKEAPRIPDPKHNLVLKAKIRNLRPGGKELYAVLHLGRPKSVSSLRRARIPKQNFEETYQRKLKPEEQIATLQVFRYDFNSDAEVFLENHFWEPAFTGEPSTINLHIFSAHEHEPERGFDHACDAFNQCISLFEGIKLQLKKSAPVTEEGDLPDGVRPEEKEDLAPRTRRLARLGRMQKDNQFDFINQLWFDFDPADTDPSVCGDAWGRG